MLRAAQVVAVAAVLVLAATPLVEWKRTTGSKPPPNVQQRKPRPLDAPRQGEEHA